MTKEITAYTPLDEKYRPKTLDRVIGHEKVVQRLQGIISSKKYPNAMLFAGPSSAGKTTLARAFVASLFGIESVGSGLSLPDYHEINAADTRSIDDMRQLLSVAKLKPREAPRRVFLIDEAQQLLNPSVQVLLKPLENPPPHTLWIVGSMEPEKLPQAIKNRCSQFVLSMPDKEHMAKFVKRIAKGEDMGYMTPELVTKVAESSNGEMRSAAKTMEALMQYVAGSKSTKLKPSDVEEALSSIEGNDDQLAVKILVAVYANKFKVVQKSLLDVQDPFKLIAKLLQFNTFLLNQEVLGGVQHKAVWWSQLNKEVLAGVKEHSKIDPKQYLLAFGLVQTSLVALRERSAAFLLPETTLISNAMFDAWQRLAPMFKTKG